MLGSRRDPRTLEAPKLSAYYRGLNNYLYCSTIWWVSTLFCRNIDLAMLRQENQEILKRVNQLQADTLRDLILKILKIKYLI